MKIAKSTNNTYFDSEFFWIVFGLLALLVIGFSIYFIYAPGVAPDSSVVIKPHVKDITANWQVATLDLGVLGISGSVQYKYPNDWMMDQNMNQQYLTPKTNRLPEEIFIYVTPVVVNDSYEFIPPTASGLPDLNPPIKTFGNNSFYYGEGKFEAQWDQKYEILNSDKTGGVSFTLIVRGGRQRMDYYLPVAEIQPEMDILGNILGTFKFNNLLPNLLPKPIISFNNGSDSDVEINIDYECGASYNIYHSVSANGPYVKAFSVDYKINSGIKEWPSGIDYKTNSKGEACGGGALIDYDYPKNVSRLYYYYAKLDTKGGEVQKSEIGEVSIN